MGPVPAVSDLIPSIPTLLSQAIAFAANRARQWGHGDRNLLGKIARMMVDLFAGWYRTLRQFDADYPPSAQSSPEGLTRSATTYGLDNGAGGYGARLPLAAKGMAGYATGTKGASVAALSALLGPDGVTQYQIRTATAIPGSPPGTDQVLVTIDAVTKGAVSNLSAGAVLSWNPAPAGVDPTLTLTVGSNSTGRDAEDSGSLYARLAEHLQNRPKGGARQDYRFWVENTTDASGTPIEGLRGWIYTAGYDGLGCVTSVVTVPGEGLARIPAADVLAAVNRFVRGSTAAAGQSPNASAFRAIGPVMDPLVSGIVIDVQLKPRPAYAFDWVSSLFAWSVSAWDGTSKLTLNAVAPSDLLLAIDQGLKPRLFVDARGGGGIPIGPVVPVLTRVVSYNPANKAELTLETPLSAGLTIAAGGRVYSGQAQVCPLVGESIQNLVRNLGPSRVSGYADPNDTQWRDQLKIGNITTAAENTTDSDGATLLIDGVAAGGVLAAVGTATPAAADLTPADNGLTGPTLFYALRINVHD